MEPAELARFQSGKNLPNDPEMAEPISPLHRYRDGKRKGENLENSKPVEATCAGYPAGHLLRLLPV